MKVQSVCILFSLALVFCSRCPAGSAPGGDAVLHWKFDEGEGPVVRDSSGRGLDGKVRAAWEYSRGRNVLFFDGASSSVADVILPEDLRFGRGSWTFTAWLKPERFETEDSRRLPRIFTFGVWPDAYIMIDIRGDGRPRFYCRYKDGRGGFVSAGSVSHIGLSAGEWQHLALVVDREENQTEFFINGVGSGPAALPAGFEGDFSLGGRLTVGSSWQNYTGMAGGVVVFRRALSARGVRSEFHRSRKVFGVPAPGEVVFEDAVERAEAAREKGEMDVFRGQFELIMNSMELPVYKRSYAALRAAHSYREEGDFSSAEKEYERIRVTEEFPDVHRFEAERMIEEMERPGSVPAGRRAQIDTVDSFALKIYLAPDGDDASGDGSKERPFATPGRARDRIREVKLRGGKDGAICVLFAPGEYGISEPVVFTELDAGSKESPIVYRAEKAGEVVFYGGARLEGFRLVEDPEVLYRLPVQSRGKVFQCDLKASGIKEYGSLAVRGFGQPPSPPTLELYFNGKPMTPARWPNDGFVVVEELVKPGCREKGESSVLRYESDRPERWLEAEDPWLFGYFHYLWADSTIKIGAIDADARTITTDKAYDYGGRGMSDAQGIIYYAFNLLEEIEKPGEWYLDRGNGILYFYPPSAPETAEVEIGVLAEPMVSIENAAHMRFEGIVFDLARGDGIRVRNSVNILFAGCTVKRMAGNAIMVRGGRKNGIFGCDIYKIGRRAVEITGGDRETLVPSGHFVENCKIHSFGRIDRTYTPAVQLEGVGGRVAYNLMYNAPSSAMRLEGNDHLVEFNEIHSVVTESDDQGAIDMCGNPVYRGNVFRYNFFHNIGKTGTEPYLHGWAAIRFDGVISGQLVYCNIFARSADGNFGAVKIHGGRDNIIDNNLFYDCVTGVAGGWNPGSGVWSEIRAGTRRYSPDYRESELYLRRYPELADMLDDRGGNHLWRNIFYGCGENIRNRRYLTQVGNSSFELDEDPGFKAPSSGDFRLRAGSELSLATGFRPVPAEEIGPYECGYRATWPVESGRSKAFAVELPNR